MVQATSEAIPRTTPAKASPDGTVVVNSDDPNLISTQDIPGTIIDEGGKWIEPDNSTITRDDTEKDLPEDDTTIGIPELNKEEDYPALIAPQAQADNTAIVLGIGVMLAALAISAVFLVARSPNQI